MASLALLQGLAGGFQGAGAGLAQLVALLQAEEDRERQLAMKGYTEEPRTVQQPTATGSFQLPDLQLELAQENSARALARAAAQSPAPSRDPADMPPEIGLVSSTEPTIRGHKAPMRFAERGSIAPGVMEVPGTELYYDPRLDIPRQARELAAEAAFGRQKSLVELEDQLRRRADEEAYRRELPLARYGAESDRIRSNAAMVDALRRAAEREGPPPTFTEYKAERLPRLTQPVTTVAGLRVPGMSIDEAEAQAAREYESIYGPTPETGVLLRSPVPAPADSAAASGLESTGWPWFDAARDWTQSWLGDLFGGEGEARGASPAGGERPKTQLELDVDAELARGKTGDQVLSDMRAAGVPYVTVQAAEMYLRSIGRLDGI